ncbi:MAG: hypothetical protein ACP5HG_10540 [Anaerolineae bacterium]
MLTAVLLHFFLNFTFGLAYPVSVRFDLIRVILTVVAVAAVVRITRNEGKR